MYNTGCSGIPCLKNYAGAVSPPGAAGGVAAILSRVSALGGVLLFSVLLTPVVCEAAEKEVLFDVSKTRQTFDGFGAQIWAFNNNSEVDLPALLQQLNIKYVRLTRQGASWEQMAALREITDRFGIRWVYVVWSAPDELTDGKGMLRDVAGFSRWWAEEVDSLATNDVRPHYIELMNEPDSEGRWSTGIDPRIYNELVKSVRNRLDRHGYGDIDIVGPGLAHLDWRDNTSKWMRALDPRAVSALGAWSTHSWDDGDLCRGGSSCIESQWADFGTAARSQDAAKPVFVTEYASKETNFHGVQYPHPDNRTRFDVEDGYGYYSATNTMPFAVRLVENTLALLNKGANVSFVWQLVDEETELVRDRKSWGLVDLKGNAKPAFGALKTLCSRIPVGAQVVAPPDQTEHEMYSAAFVHRGKVVVAVANDTGAEQTSRFRLDRAGTGLSIVEATAYRLHHRGNPDNGEPDRGRALVQHLELTAVGGGDYTFDATLPADSTLTVVLQKTIAAPTLTIAPTDPNY